MCPSDDDVLKVLLQQRRLAESLGQEQTEQASIVNDASASTEALLKSLNVTPSQRSVSGSVESVPRLPNLRPWSELLAEAQAEAPGQVSIADLLSAEEVRAVVEKHRALEGEFDALHTLDAFDWTISGGAGVLAALIDIFLVQVPAHPGFLGGQAAEGGWLSNAVRNGIGKVLPEEKIRSLEATYRVSYDASTSRGLGEEVPGLGPGTHRFQSLGHDPILGWIFGVRDLLRGEFTAIGKDGRVICQAATEPFMAGEHLYARLFEALRMVGGHLLSDLGTARGIPAPLTPLLLFLQQGTIGKHQYSVAEMSRQMYRMGYDFRHFLASSVPVMVIEAVVRIAFFARAIHEGRPLADAVPLASIPKVRTQLFIAHSVAAAVNAGKVYVTQNPLGVNWAQWLAFFRYLVPQLKWALLGAERERLRYVEGRIEEAWRLLDRENARLWKELFGDGEQAVL